MNRRYKSLDTFRGATVALMILVNNPGSWSNMFSQVSHAKWHGCTPTDLVFPFFLFAVGNAMAFVIPSLQERGDVIFWQKVIKRSLLIFGIGIFLNWSPFVMYAGDELKLKAWEWTNPKDNSLAGIRIFGVLQRIAICYFFASVIVYYLKPKIAFLTGVFILLLYWVLSFLLGSPIDPYSLQGFWGTKIDLNLVGLPHIYKGEGVPFDPEGLASTIPAIIQVLFGYFIGTYIQQKGKTYEMLSNLFVIGLLFMTAGYFWDLVYPINKKIWTSSYVIYTTGLAIVTLAILIYLIEFKEQNGGWSKFFDVFGKNALFIFVLSGFLPRLLALIRITNTDTTILRPYLSPLEWFYHHICKNISSDLRVGSLLYAIIMIAFYWLIVYVLDKKRIYIKV